MIQKYSLALLGILVAYHLYIPAYSQGVTIGSNNPPDPAAVLDLQSSNKGLLPPRLTTAQRNAISNPPFGLVIYNTDTDCVEAFFSQGGWKPINCGCTVFPDATFNIPNANVNSPVTIAANTSGLTYSWTFQNGSPATSTSQSTQVTWANAGTYTITLTVTDQNGCTSTQTGTITVSNCTPFTLTLNNCTASGRNGPNQGQCNGVYGNGVVTVNSGIQSWVVPQSGTYRLEAAGALGGGTGNGTPGLGARMAGDFTLTAGQILEVGIGQVGVTGGQGGGGGGGTFVVLSGQPILVAGGGGGSHYNNNSTGLPGNTTTSGTSNPSTGSGYTSGSGASFATNGANGDYSTTGGKRWAEGLVGGTMHVGGGGHWSGGDGGFGGGGGGCWAPGSGGGYNGGISATSGGNSTPGGGGAGSFNTGTNQANQTGANSGNGYLIITLVCP